MGLGVCRLSAVLSVVLSSVLMVMPATANSGNFLKAKLDGSQTEVLTDSFGRDTPRSTMQNFVKTLSEQDFELTAYYLDSDYLKKHNTKTTINTLQTALDMGGRLEPDLSLSDKPEGDLADKLPSDSEKVGVIDIGDESIDLFLTKKIDKNNVIYWQISKQTLQELPKNLKPTHPTLASWFGLDFLADKQLFEHKLSDIVSLAMLLVMGILLFWGSLASVWVLCAFLYPKFAKKPFAIPFKALLPLAIVLLAMALPEIMVQMGVPVTLRSAVTRGKEVASSLAMAWLALRVIDVVFGRAEAGSLRRKRPEQVSILNLLRKVTKAFMLILAVIVIFGNLGFDLTTGIAALGVGGLALAFGAQKTIENLIGSVVVVADRPVHVGDFCRFGNMEGVVIDIGIRSSRIRTLNRTIVTVPNGEFSAMQIENYTARDMFYFYHFLYLKRSTTPNEVAKLITHLEQFLQNHEYVNDEWTKVRLSELHKDAYVVEMRCYLNAPDVNVFYDRQTRLLVDVLNEVADCGIEHALPTQELYVSARHQSGDDLANPNPKEN